MIKRRQRKLLGTLLAGAFLILSKDCGVRAEPSAQVAPDETPALRKGYSPTGRIVQQQLEPRSRQIPTSIDGSELPRRLAPSSVEEMEKIDYYSQFPRKPSSSLKSSQPSKRQLLSLKDATISKNDKSNKASHQFQRRASTKVSKCPDGVKHIITCSFKIPKKDCYAALQAHEGVKVVASLPRTSHLAICVAEDLDWQEEFGEMITAVQDDPIRTLSDMPEYDYFPSRRLQEEGQVIPYGLELLNVTGFWDVYPSARGAGVTVCIVDTGLYTTHEDLRGANFDGSNDKDLQTPWDKDGNSHGTHIAGTIIASDNQMGIIGVAPSASVYVARAFDDRGQFTASDLVQAMEVCVKDGNADIISMSLGGRVDSSVEQEVAETLWDQGVLLIAATGNTALRGNTMEYPASYPTVMSVTAVDENQHIADFSTYNSYVDIAGPGVEILSLGSRTDSTYMTKTGTSMAVPHIAGIAALLWSQFPQASNEDIRQAIEASARDAGACGRDPIFGHGVANAMEAARFLEDPTKTGAPEQSDCVNVRIQVTTDDWGEETTFGIESKTTSELIYRGGPFVNDVRATYDFDVSLPRGCYKFTLYDTYGDGHMDSASGIAVVVGDYNEGEGIFEISDFGGFSKSVSFGHCTNVALPLPLRTAAPSVSSYPTSSPLPTNWVNGTCGDGILEEDVEECDDGNLEEGDGCSSNCTLEFDFAPFGCERNEMLLDLFLETDRWSRNENSLYLIDENAPDNDWIWAVDRNSFEPESEYISSICLKFESCYQFTFLDSWGDGFDTGGLVLKVDYDIALEIFPGDLGTRLEEVGSGNLTSFWTHNFGSCNTTVVAD